MKTDGLQLRLPDDGNRPNNHICKNQESFQEGGLKIHGQSGISFKELYLQIAKSNKEAKENTEKNIDSKSNMDFTGEKTPDSVSFEHDFARGIYLEILDQTEDFCGSETSSIMQNKLAAETIQEALINISRELKLQIDQDIDKLSFENGVSDETVDYLAEIVMLLKEIINCLDSTAINNESVEIGDRIISPEMNDEICDYIRKNMFMIEIGLNMLNISSEIGQKLSELTNQKHAGNIPQAINPSDLSMPSRHAQKLFDNLVVNPEKEVESLIKKISLLISENADQKQSSLSINAGVTRHSELEKFDSQTFRQMLRLENRLENVKENTEAVKIENEEAARGNEKMNLPGISEIITADVNEIQNDTEGTEQVTSSSPTIKPLAVSESNFIESKLSSALGRTLDDSVMNQVNEKLNTAIRSGINEVRIQLRPESLGDVKCQIRMEGDIVIVKFQVESQQVKQIIESNMQSLKDTLAQQNLQTGSFDVDVGGNAWNRDSDMYAARNGNSGARKRFGDNSQFSDDASDNESSGITLGTETGKRYGNNSVEYFG